MADSWPEAVPPATQRYTVALVSPSVETSAGILVNTPCRGGAQGAGLGLEPCKCGPLGCSGKASARCHLLLLLQVRQMAAPRLYSAPDSMQAGDAGWQHRIAEAGVAGGQRRAAEAGPSSGCRPLTLVLRPWKGREATRVGLVHAPRGPLQQGRGNRQQSIEVAGAAEQGRRNHPTSHALFELGACVAGQHTWAAAATAGVGLVLAEVAAGAAAEARAQEGRVAVAAVVVAAREREGRAAGTAQEGRAAVAAVAAAVREREGWAAETAREGRAAVAGAVAEARAQEGRGAEAAVGAVARERGGWAAGTAVVAARELEGLAEAKEEEGRGEAVAIAAAGREWEGLAAGRVWGVRDRAAVVSRAVARGWEGLVAAMVLRARG